MLLTTSVLPTWAEDITTTVSTLGSVKASMMPRWYSARAVTHLPGSALASADNCRNRSAHSLTVRRGGGAQTWRASWRVSMAAAEASILRYGDELDALELFEGFMHALC